MAERSGDWMRQAEADLRHARNALEVGDFEWAAFASQQSGEKAIKALFQKLNLDAWGHALSLLLANLPDEVKPESSLINLAKELDKHYIPTRYPNGFDRGAPVDFYTEKEAREAIGSAEAIVDYCRRKIGRLGTRSAAAWMPTHADCSNRIPKSTKSSCLAASRQAIMLPVAISIFSLCSRDRHAQLGTESPNTCRTSSPSPSICFPSPAPS